MILIGHAMHKDHLKSNFTFNKRDDLITHMLVRSTMLFAFVKCAYFHLFECNFIFLICRTISKPNMEPPYRQRQGVLLWMLAQH